ncbi:MAG: Gfo/Idh/MocA family oxidoreductase [Chloroflexi bacterium]|nr:Gfo/Idh/MocA family oxidoreductase [Chloroflexota bacterium]
MSNTPIRFGILGAARIARTQLIPAMRQSAEVELVAIASRDGAKAQAAALELNIPRAYGSYEELLADPDVDAIYNPLPNHLHAEWSIKAAQAGKHILCEKPLAMNVDECLEMGAAADKASVILMEAFMYRFHPRFELARQLVAGGKIGRLRTIRSSFSFTLTNPENIRMKPEWGGGALMDIGCYCINASRLLAGSEPDIAFAWAENGDTGVDMAYNGMLHFPGAQGEVVAQFDVSYLAVRNQSYEAAGTGGSLHVRQGAFLPPDHDPKPIELLTHEGATTLTAEGANPYMRMVDHFARCIRGQETLRWTVTDAAANMAAIEALATSARSGRPVPVRAIP